MSLTTKIDDPRSFDRATVGLLAGGLAAGVVTAVLATVFHASAAGLGALAFGVVVGLVTYLVDDTEDDALIGLLLSIGGGVVLAAGLGMGLAVAGWLATGVAGALIGLGAGARHMDSRRRLFWTVLSAVGLLAARFTTLELLSPERFSALESSALQHVLSSGIWGLFLSGVVGTGFVRLDRDEVVARLDKARAASIAPVARSLESARELYRKIMGEVERDAASGLEDRARAIAVETIDSLIEFSLRYTELRDGISADKAGDLRARSDALEARIDEARNPELAAQLSQTRREVLGQLDMQEELELACARLEARGQRCVTMLERLHVTLVQNASGELQNRTLTESFEELEHLTDEVHMKSLTVEQLLSAAADDGEPERDGALDDGTDGATLGGTRCESDEATTESEKAPREQERDDVVRAEHQSC
ncbi:MAG: hypothetical protein ACQEVA_15130 [Myxococcota bacterium]